MCTAAWRGSVPALTPSPKTRSQPAKDVRFEDFLHAFPWGQRSVLDHSTERRQLERILNLICGRWKNLFYFWWDEDEQTHPQNWCVHLMSFRWQFLEHVIWAVLQWVHHQLALTCSPDCTTVHCQRCILLHTSSSRILPAVLLWSYFCCSIDGGSATQKTTRKKLKKHSRKKGAQMCVAPYMVVDKQGLWRLPCTRCVYLPFFGKHNRN